MLFFLPTLRIAAIDPALGRLNYESLSDQTLMEMLFDGLNTKDKRRLQDGNGSYADACEWKYGFHIAVQCTDELVTQIFMKARSFSSKPFPFNFIPPKTRSFTVKDCGIQGTLETALLPVHLSKFSVADNKLYGTIDFQAFPNTIQCIYIYGNAFSGSCVLADLPRTVVVFNAKKNNFCGSLSLDQLPLAMEMLIVSENNFTGSIDIARLRRRVEHVDLSQNAFSGDFRLLTFPDYLETICIRGNAIKKAVLRGSSGEMFFTLQHDSITEVVDETGRRHSWAETVLNYL